MNGTYMDEDEIDNERLSSKQLDERDDEDDEDNDNKYAKSKEDDNDDNGKEDDDNNRGDDNDDKENGEDNDDGDDDHEDSNKKKNQSSSGAAASTTKTGGGAGLLKPKSEPNMLGKNKLKRSLLSFQLFKRKTTADTEGEGADEEEISNTEAKRRKKKGTYKSSAVIQDTTGIPVLEGYLLKYSSQFGGRWQKRYFKTNNTYLNYYSSKKDADMGKVKVAIDLAELSEANIVGRFGEFEFTLDDGTMYRLKAPSAAIADDWVTNINKRQEYSIEFASKQETTSNDKETQTSSSKFPTKEGWLGKKSVTRFKGWQEYFFRLKDGVLYFYKSEGTDSSNPEGDIVIDETCRISTISSKHENEQNEQDGTQSKTKGKSRHTEREFVIYIENKFRQIKLVAANAEEQADWIKVLQATKTLAGQRTDESNRQNADRRSSSLGDDVDPSGLNISEANDTLENEEDKELREKRSKLMTRPLPQWIKVWKSLDETQRIIKMEEKLNIMFPSTSDVGKVITAATALLEDLDNIAKQTLPSSVSIDEASAARSPGKKFDSAITSSKDTNTRKNMTLEERIMDPTLLTESGRPACVDVFIYFLKSYHIRIIREVGILVEKVYDLSSLDLIRLMDLITAYNSKLQELLQGDIGEYLKTKIPPFSPLLNSINTMADIYIEGLKSTLQSWISNIVNVSKDKESVDQRVKKRSDGRLWTPGPTDLFNIFNESMQMAMASGSRYLQGKVIMVSFEFITNYLRDIVDDLEKTKKVEFFYAVALANDCWKIADHLDEIEATYSTIIMFENVDIDPLRKSCHSYSLKCLNVIVELIRGDIAKEGISNLFTEKHFQPPSSSPQDDVLTVCIATYDDYLQEMKELIEIPLVLKILKLCVADFAYEYVARAMTASSERKHYMLTEKDIDTISKDRAGILELAAALKVVDATKVDSLLKNELVLFDEFYKYMNSGSQMLPSLMEGLMKNQPYAADHVYKFTIAVIDLRASIVGDLAKEAKAECAKIKASFVYPSTEKLPDAAVIDANYYVRLFPGESIKAPAVEKPKKATRGIFRKTEPAPVAPPPEAPTPQKNVDEAKEEEKANAEANKRRTKVRNISLAQFFRDGGKAISKSGFKVTDPDQLGSVEKFNELPGIILRGYLDMLEKNGNWKQRFCTLKITSNPEKDDELDTAFIIYKSLNGGEEKKIFIGNITRIDCALLSKASDTATAATSKPSKKSVAAAAAAAAASAESKNEASEDTSKLKSGEEATKSKSGKDKTPTKKSGSAVANATAMTSSLVKSAIKTISDASSSVFSSDDNDFSIVLASGITETFRTKSREHLMIWVAHLQEALSPAAEDAPTGADAKKSGLSKFRNAVEQIAKTRRFPKDSSKPKFSRNDKVECVRADGTVQVGRILELQQQKTIAQSADNPDGEEINIFLYSIQLIDESEITVEENKIKRVSDEIYEQQVNESRKQATGGEPQVESSDEYFDRTKMQFLSTLPVKDLEQRCDKLGIDHSKMIEKIQYVRAIVEREKELSLNGEKASAAKATDTGTQQDNEAIVRNFIGEGMMMVSNGQYPEAKNHFTIAVQKAHDIGNSSLEGKAYSGLASAYLGMPDMVNAAPQIFEIAAQLFGVAGEESDRIAALADAGEAYRKINDTENAVRCLTEHDDANEQNGGPRVFTQVIHDLTNIPKKPTKKYTFGFFSSSS